MLAGYTNVPSDYTGKVYLEGQVAELEQEIQRLKSLQADSFRGQSMNNSIKALMGKVLDENFKETWTSMTHQDLEKFAEKFAELIVKECSKVIGDNGYTRGAFGYEALPPGEIATLIEEHFGVE
jgi:hypothetical protein